MRRATILAAMVVLASCDKSPTAPSDALLVTAFATPQSVKAGGTTNVIIAITNESNTAQTYDQNFCGPAYHVFAPDGSQVTTSTGACFSVIQFRTLAPGEQAIYAAQWSTIALDSTGRPAGPLAAGTYTIRGASPGNFDATKVSNVAFTLQITP